ncbi:MAG: hypothetical protein ABIA63_08110, partial [bacterium]
EPFGRFRGLRDCEAWTVLVSYRIKNYNISINMENYSRICNLNITSGFPLFIQPDRPIGKEIYDIQ